MRPDARDAIWPCRARLRRLWFADTSPGTDPTRKIETPGHAPGARDDRDVGANASRLGGAARAGLLALAGLLTIPLALAGRLTPDPRGYGTHEQLGLPPCAILLRTGRPCATCGMTTAYARLARGEVVGAFRANPVGPLTAAGSIVLVPWLIAGGLTGKAPFVRDPGSALMALAVAWAALVAIAWAIRRGLGGP